MNRPASSENRCGRLVRAQFEALIPHSGRMCLIDSVEFWDERSIECLSSTHLHKDNPLRIDGELSPIHLLEYGAQAMAIHGGLRDCSATRGMLAALRNVKLYIETTEKLGAEIRVRAFAEGRSSQVAMYRFEVLDSNDSIVVEARATVINQQSVARESGL